ncbi:MAG: hypothetical protein JNL79_12620 [Myxococcales bacterium]|nr:hypothetical protein [Myxococcales bacterium]
MNKGVVAVVALGFAFGACNRHAPEPPKVATPPAPPKAYVMVEPPSRFAPAFVRLETSEKVDVGTLGDPVQCAGCHADVVAQWDPSAHHNSSFSNRFYASAVDLTRKHRGNKTSRWCGGCHDPSLMFDGATATTVDPLIDKDDAPKSPRAGDGLGCLVCHSIAEGARVGGGGYLLKYTGAFKEPDPKDPKAVAAHKAAMKTKTTESPELCASCHKVSLHADVNGKRWLRGQNDFDGWEQGPFAFGGKKTAGFLYAPEVEAKRCQDCHMPHEAAPKGDLSAKPVGGEKKVRSHRFLAANTALPTFAGDKETVLRQQAFLKDVVRVDVVAVRRGPSYQRVEDAKIVPGESIAVDVVIENTKVGHKFPTGTVDSNEIWLELEVRDAKGQLLGKSGALDKDGVLGSEAHRFGVLQLDNDGKPALFRDAHRFAAAGWDTTIPPQDSRVVRYALPVPLDVAQPLSVRARVLYRKFSPVFTKSACVNEFASAPPMKSCPELPITEVSADTVVLGAPTVAGKPDAFRRHLAYGRGLLNALQEDVGDAQGPLAKAVELAPHKAHGFIDLARMYVRQGRTLDADAMLDAAQKLDPETPVIPFLRGVARYEVYKLADAVEPLRLGFLRSPHVVHGAELLGEALELKGDDLGALGVIQQALHVDPESAQLQHLQALAYDRLGMKEDAELARAAYLKYRRDDDTPKLRSLCKAHVPGCAREAMPLHAHELSLP